MPSREIVRQRVGGVWKTSDVAGGGGGGSQPWEITDLAFDTPNLSIQNFPITAITQDDGDGHGVIGIAGDHAALFPVGATMGITGSSGNDGGSFVVFSVSFATGTTTIKVTQTLNDATVDGNVGNVGTAGIVIATLAAGDFLLEGTDQPLSIGEAWDDGKLWCTFGDVADRGQQYVFDSADLTVSDTPVGSGAVSVVAIPLLTAPSVAAFIANTDTTVVGYVAGSDAVVAPVTSHGAGRLALPVARA